MNARRLGLLCMFGGIAYLINAVYGSITGTGETVGMLNGLLALVWATGAICGWLAIIQLRGSGENPIVRLLSFVPIVGLSIVWIATAYGLLTVGSVTFTSIFAIGFLLEMAGAVLVGIFVIAARRLSGWHRFTPFFIVLAIIAGGLISGATKGSILGIPLCLGIAYTLLGNAVRTEDEFSGVEQSVQVVPG